MPYNVRAGGSHAMAREYAGGSINGILRKTGAAAAASSASTSGGGGSANGAGYAATPSDARQTAVELLVFGYACKIFRDDEKAREMDHGKQLIPWMGDVNLKIDRYDVRGALCELSTYEAPPGGYGNRLEYLSAEEQRAEQLCEEERYLFLYNNEEELRLQQEEDLKRLQQETSGSSYSQVDFQYDAQQQSATAASADGDSAVSSPMTESSTTPIDECELPFILPPNLLVAPTPGTQLPETMKQHAIIEKTARFIATQGAQMEILIKAKQANNAQFDFLSQGDQLQPYYRHLLSAIKQGKYAPAPDTSMDKANPNMSDENSTPPDSGSPKRNQQVITVPTIKYKPSANCAYTQLISKIKGVPLQSVLDDDVNSQHSGDTASPTLSCKSDGQSQGSSTTNTNSTAVAGPAAAAGAGANGDFTPVLLQYNGSTFAHEEENANDVPPKVELIKNTSALALAQDYSSDSEDEENDADDDSNGQQLPQPMQQQTTVSTNKISNFPKSVVGLAPPALLKFPMPEENLRHIIDKTATYVIKNGRQFEETLRTKSVERFNFLLPENKYYAYYMYKITGDAEAASKEEKTRKAAAVAAALISKKGLGTAAASATTASTVTTTTSSSNEKSPVCFSIRARDENAPLQSTLPHEASDDEDDVDAKANADSQRSSMPDCVQRAIKQVETQLLARTGNQKGNGATTPSITSPLKEQRQAEDRVKDKLAQIAREKLNGMVSREKQLQLERKRKAMAFLNQIKGENAGIVSSAATEAASKACAKANADAEALAAASNNDDDSDDSVRSIPITYFGPDDDDDDDDNANANANDNDNGRAKVADAESTADNNNVNNNDDGDNDNDEEDDDGDLEKYNLLNDDSTNTYTTSSKAAPPPSSTVLLSDDDDVELITSVAPPPPPKKVSRARKTNHRSRSSSCSTMHDAASVTSSNSTVSSRRSRSRDRTSIKQRQRLKRKADELSKHRHRRRSRTKTPSPSLRHKHRSPSRSSSHSSSRRQRSHHTHHHHHQQHQRDEEEAASARRRHQRNASKKSHKRHKKRRRSSAGSNSQ